MSKLHIALAALFAGAIALPAMATGGNSEKEALEQAAPEPQVYSTEEPIVVIAYNDVNFSSDFDTEGSPELVQYSYDWVDGQWKDVDNLSHPDYPFAKVAIEDMVQQYPGA